MTTMTKNEQMVAAHFAVTELGQTKAAVAREFGISPRTLGRWLETVDTVRELAKLEREPEVVPVVTEEVVEPALAKRKTWTFVNPNPTRYADKKARVNKPTKKPVPEKRGFNKGYDAASPESMARLAAFAKELNGY